MMSTGILPVIGVGILIVIVFPAIAIVYSASRIIYAILRVQHQMSAQVNYVGGVNSNIATNE